MNVETSFSSSFKLPNPGLRSYFNRVVSGQPDEYRTPFYEGKELKRILGDWLRILEPGIRAKWNGLWEFESDLAKKVGPLSIMKPLRERIPDIKAYYEGILLPSEPLSEQAITATCSEWNAYRGVRQRSQRRTIEIMKKSTNSGSPYFSKRRLVVERTAPCRCWISGNFVYQELGIPYASATIADWGHSFHMHDLPGKVWRACAVLGWRGQEGGPADEDVKQRVVWMFPFAINIRELQMYQPLIEAAQRGNIVPAWNGMDAVDAEITQLFDTKNPQDLIVCTDFSKFDQHFGRHMQLAAESCLKYICSHDGQTVDWIRNVFPIKYCIPLAVDWGKVVTGDHGMASGSGGTNFDETLSHRCLQHEAAFANGASLNPHSMCLGDDGILTYPGITIEQVTSAYTKHGLVMNEEKQSADAHECTYLRRWHHQDYRVDGKCVGVYSTCRALGRLAEQERYYDPDTWSREMVALRQLSILENCKYHPMREEFARFCMKGDKYRLGIDIPGFLEHISRYAQKAIDYMPDFLGYTRTLGLDSDKNVADGINNWWIVQFLKSEA